MQATGPRGSIGKASYEAVRKHIDAGKKATEAFRLVAEETGRSTATVQTAYYRVARSLPDGGGVQLRPRKSKKVASRRGAKAAGASSTGARRGRPPKSTSAGSGTAAGAARQLSAAAEALVDHITRLESELADARKDSKRLAEIERALGR
jgi:hypothetical protein